MTFDNLHIDTACDCLEAAKEDFNSIYGIKADKAVLRLNDFKTKWEKGDRCDQTDCRRVAGLKGKSMSVINGANFEFVKKLYSQMGSVAPGYKKYMLLLKFSDNTGKIAVTPSHANPHHHDFYKCDQFDLRNVTLAESIQIAGNV